jgi:hypothetical protein
VGGNLDHKYFSAIHPALISTYCIPGPELTTGDTKIRQIHPLGVYNLAAEEIWKSEKL